MPLLYKWAQALCIRIVVNKTMFFKNETKGTSLIVMEKDCVSNGLEHCYFHARMLIMPHPVLGDFLIT
jgi:hypothetical protein